MGKSSTSKRVILIHGFHRNFHDMAPLKKHLKQRGYRVARVNLPLNYTTIEEATHVFINSIKSKLSLLKKGEKIHLIGHSTGGLIIRHFLTYHEFLPYIDKCVLIATPNQGYTLAEKISNLSKTYVNIYKTMASLKPDHVLAMNLINEGAYIGAIAGTKTIPGFTLFIDGTNDGRLSVSSVYYEALKDFTLLPYHHLEIHKMEETAQIIHNFFTTGYFYPLN